MTDGLFSWERVKEVFHAALMRAPEDRARFLGETCGSDAALRRDVESLLAAHEQAGRFAEGPRRMAALSALAPNSSFGPYQILHKIGTGGMGEVYRARDARLGRDVALKVLPRELAGDPDRAARLEREARLLAALNHPHIATIHGFEEGPAEAGLYVRALVMELVEGPTLRERLARGPLRLEEALRIAAQIADALAAAHDKRIVHRDLKPENIKLTASGAVKVLDFGLAKPVSAAALGSVAGSIAPSTVEGTLAGTPAYMSPEQARGQAVDHQTDVWAFGCVLFELLTGKSAFEGATTTETLARVLEREPDWSVLDERAPRAIAMLIKRCLRKDPTRRLRNLADARLEIEDAFLGPADERAPRDPVARSTRGSIVLFAALAVLAGIAIVAIPWRPVAGGPEVARVIMDVAPAEEVGTGSVLDVLPGGSRTALTWSPDGRTLAFIGVTDRMRRIYLRDLRSDAARALDGTEGAESLAFSADGAWVAFWADNEIRKVRTSGGPVGKICDAGRVTGIHWGATRLVFTAGSGLFTVSPDAVSADGGEPQLVHRSDVRVSSPFLLPGEQTVLYTEHDRLWTSGNERVVARSFSSAAESTVIVHKGADARYLPAGYLAFLRQGTVYVVPFNADSLEVRGGEVAVLKEVAQAVSTWSGNDLTLAGQFAISPQGALAYLTGTPRLPVSEPVVVNRRGEVTPLGAPPDVYRERMEVSPDGTRMVFPVQNPNGLRLFVYDRVRGIRMPLLGESAGREMFSPTWSRDGKIAASVYQGGIEVFRPDSPAAAQRIDGSDGFIASAWSSDGERLIGRRGTDLWVYSLREAKWTRLTESPSNEQFAAWSRDGAWVAYSSNVSDVAEVYVQEYPGPARPVQISTNRGWSPVWNPNGRELFYVEGRLAQDDELRMMSVDMSNPLRPGKPVELFTFSPANLLLVPCNPTACFSVSPDGEEFFTVRMLPHEPAHVSQIRVILSWVEELKQLVPAA